MTLKDGLQLQHPAQRGGTNAHPDERISWVLWQGLHQCDIQLSGHCMNGRRGAQYLDWGLARYTKS